MNRLLLLAIFFAAVALVTSGPVGNELLARQLPNEKNPNQYCGQPVDRGGCPIAFPCGMELNDWANMKQLRCPCYGFCSDGYQICYNDVNKYLATQYCFTSSTNIAKGCESYCQKHCNQIDLDDLYHRPACKDFKYPLPDPLRPQFPLTEIPVEDTQIASGPIRLDQFPRPLELSFGGDSAAPHQQPSNSGEDTRSSDYDGFNGWTDPTDKSAVPQALAFNIFDNPSSNLNDLDIWSID